MRNAFCPSSFLFKDTLKTFNNFKTNENVFYLRIMYILKVYSIHSLYLDIKYKCYKISFDKINVTKNALFLFRELRRITVLLFIRDSYMSWSTRFLSLKLRVKFSFRFRFVFVNVYVFAQQNEWISLSLKCHNSFQN